MISTVSIFIAVHSFIHTRIKNKFFAEIIKKCHSALFFTENSIFTLSFILLVLVMSKNLDFNKRKRYALLASFSMTLLALPLFDLYKNCYSNNNGTVIDMSVATTTTTTTIPNTSHVSSKTQLKANVSTVQLDIMKIDI